MGIVASVVCVWLDYISIPVIRAYSVKTKGQKHKKCSRLINQLHRFYLLIKERDVWSCFITN